MNWRVPKWLNNSFRAKLPERVEFEMYDEDRRQIGIEVEDDHDALRWVLIRYGCEGNDDERMAGRQCNLSELAAIYRHTAEHLHKERQREASMVALGRSVVEAIRASKIEEVKA